MSSDGGMAWRALYPITSMVEGTVVGPTYAHLGVISVDQYALANCGIAQISTEDEGWELGRR